MHGKTTLGNFVLVKHCACKAFSFFFMSCFTRNFPTILGKGFFFSKFNCSLLVNPSHTNEPGKNKTRVCGYIRCDVIHSALWRTMIRTKYFSFVQRKHLAKLSTWCLEHSGDISRSLLVNPSTTDES